MITQARLKELFFYDPKTGLLTNRVVRRGSRGAKIGDAVGTLGTRGYLVVTIDYHLYYVHQLAWLYMTGKWVSGGIDHRDTNTTNNRFENLRPAGQTENNANKRKPATMNGIPTTSKFKGVTWHKAARKWAAQVAHRGRHYYLGLFEDEELAHAAYVEKATELFGEYSRAA